MNPSPQWRWLMLAAAILAAFLGAVSIYMERLQGRSFIALCVIAVVLGGVGYRWARDRVLPAWEQLSRVRRVLLIALAAAVALGGRFVVNRHKPDEAIADVMVVIGVLVALGLMGLYRKITHL